MARTTTQNGRAVDLDSLSHLSEKLIPIGVLVGMIVGLMRWLYSKAIRQQLAEMEAKILRAIRTDRADHERFWHGQQPPPPTWVRPDPNGTGPPGYVGERRR